MILETLQLLAFRNIQQTDLQLDPQLNIFFGANGAGKTSLLEAIHLLGTARSFRTANLSDVIQFGSDSLVLSGRVRAPQAEGTQLIGIQRAQGRSRLLVDGQAQRSSSSLAVLLPLQLITPESLRFLYGGSVERRTQLDWALFHGEPDYRQHSRRYARALSQRNSLLKQGAANRELAPWEQEMVQSARHLHQRREAYARRFTEFLNKWLQDVFPFSLEMAYSPGWDTGMDLGEALQSRLARDRELGHTSAGPHRADLVFTLEDRPLNRVLSRGQAKLFVNGVLTAQSALLAEDKGIQAVMLVDDLPAEFDDAARTNFLSLLKRTGSQIFVTSTEANLVPVEAWPRHSMFHVEHGQINA
jgi:DNA replication and repair protein RecF